MPPSLRLRAAAAPNEGRAERRRLRPLPLLSALLGAAAAVATLVATAGPAAAPPRPEPLPLVAASVPAGEAAEPQTAFVAGGAPAKRSLLSRRVDSPVAMQGGARRQGRYDKPKKLHIRNNDRYVQRMGWDVPPQFMQMTWKKEPTLEYWSQTLKLNFPEGEDDVVTEDEVREYFTTDEYAPEAVVVGYALPHDPLKHAYVHFNTNEECIKARKEKDGGSIGKASEVKVVYTDEKKWIRIRDGARLQGGPRADWMKAYGYKAYPGYQDSWVAGGDPWFPDTGTRNHPVYPE